MAATGRSDPALPAFHESLISLSQLGSCNYRTLDPDRAGSPTPTCGCLRFWIDDTRGERSWCACGHHACFHELAERRSCIESCSPRDPARHDGPRLPASPSDIASTRWQRQSPDSYRYPQPKQGLELDPIAGAPCQRLQPTEVTSPITAINVHSPRLEVHPHVSRNFSTASISERRAASVVSSNHCDPQTLSQTVGPSEYPANLPVSAPLRNRLPLPLELQNILHSHSRRLEALETCSFAHVPADEIQETFELLDGRLIDLENWRAEENSRVENDDAHSVQTDSPAECQSDEASQRLADIEDRLQYLEGAFPSYPCPWELEVVLLPWGEELQGIWVKQSIHEDEPPGSSSRSEEWNGLASHINGSYAYNSEGICWMPTWSLMAEDGLVPKAPGPNSVITKRLRSRGLVNRVTITEGGSHHIWTTISSIFSSFLSANMAGHAGISSALPDYQGLKQPIIPLRKVRKSAQLQFLATHEMVSPALWDFTFLKSGVLMKVKGKYRMYCTTPDAYIQADNGQWSWARLRMWHPPTDAGDICAGMTIESSECWNPHPVLDQDTAKSSPSSPEDDRRQSSDQSSFGSSDDDMQLSSSLPPNTATQRFVTDSSFPIFSRDLEVPASTKRGVSCFFDDTPKQKRRRHSRSVEAGRYVAERYLTPRWSSEPESPSGAVRESGFTSCGAYTPYAGPQYGYATPHSLSAAQYYLEAAGDTEPDSDASMQSGNSDVDSENEWEGVADDDEVIVPNDSAGKMVEMRDTDVRDDFEDANPRGKIMP